MDEITISLLGLAFMFALMLLRVPVGFAMLITGFVGLSVVLSPGAAFNLLTGNVWGQFSSYSFSVIPLFIFMGQLAYRAGVTEKLYRAAYKWVGHLPGGLAGTTILASMGFSAICGSNSATAATMGTIALPEMKKYSYDGTLSTGSVAIGGTLGVICPPSVVLIIIALQTEQSILGLFLSMIVPGVLLTALFLLTVVFLCMRDPALGPAGPRAGLNEKLLSLFGVIEALILFSLVTGGLYAGWFTPSEAAAAGAFGALLLALVQRNLSFENFKEAALETVRVSSMVILLITGAVLLTRFLTATRLPFFLAEWVVELPVPSLVIMAVVFAIYLVGGCLMDALGFLVVTVPIFFPVALALGYDPVHYTVLITFITTMGAVTPPVGVNVYIVSGLAPEIPINNIFKGASLFLAGYALCIIFLMIFPQLALYLPSLLR